MLNPTKATKKRKAIFLESACRPRLSFAGGTYRRDRQAQNKHLGKRGRNCCAPDMPARKTCGSVLRGVSWFVCDEVRGLVGLEAQFALSVPDEFHAPRTGYASHKHGRKSRPGLPQTPLPHRNRLRQDDRTNILGVKGLGSTDPFGLRAFSPVAHLEDNFLILFQGAVNRLDVRSMNKNVFAAFIGNDEAIPFLLIEPLHSTGRHNSNSICNPKAPSYLPMRTQSAKSVKGVARFFDRAPWNTRPQIECSTPGIGGPQRLKMPLDYRRKRVHN